ncbi:hypothetical protein AC622_20205 [Bacillus sp. FJAT-27916]|uniref:two-component system regulatory protein YycI n=1 Tax=Bacillaceae TaxID=186817 RepID=UPI000670A562|nr:two-component system regulatory protein YycI [Bacillus sp. FJAT-27916]KMY46224.1 hypothetical protein AC622_20205 [Bacillus sp. FJAT-27916]
MDWNKTKSLFIIVFLILDIFLLYQFIDFKAAKLEINKETTLEEKLKDAGIVYSSMPSGSVTEKTISAKAKVFTESDIRGLKNQDAVLGDEHTILSQLEKPIAIGTGEGKYYELQTFMEKNITAGDSYKFWRKEGQSIIYNQVYNGRMLFNNQNAQIVFQLNEKDQVVSYEQTMLDNIEEFNDNQAIDPAVKALGSLLTNGYLTNGSKVTDPELGYYTLIEVTESEILVLVPTWHFKVNGQEDYFVKGTDSEVLNTEEENLTE